MKNAILPFFFFAAVAAGASAATYVNPVLAMDFSDPDVCAASGGKYYLTASSFGALPGLPVLESEDLVNWRYVGCALKKHPFETEGPEHGNAVWAPSIRFRKGGFIIYWGDPDRGIYRTTAPEAAGPWSDPVLVKPGKGMIDPCPLYDDDGKIYLVHGWAASRAGMNSVLTVSELNADETATVGDEVVAYDGLPDGNFTAEGPKFYKKDGEYWLMFPAGGVQTGWQVAARSRSPFGPYAAKTVMAQGVTQINGPHQGAWVRTAAGEDWFVHFSDRGAYGRVVYLEPMKWRADGWPVIGDDRDGDGLGAPVTEWTMPKGGTLEAQCEYPQLDDEFDDLRLGPQWHYLGRTAAQAGFPSSQGFFRLYSTPMPGCPRIPRLFSREPGRDGDNESRVNTWNVPNLVVQKFPDFAFEATMKASVCAKVDGVEGGLVVQGRDYARIGLAPDGERFDVVYTECRGADEGGGEEQRKIETVDASVAQAGLRTVKKKDVWLKVSVRQGETPPGGLCGAPMCTFSYSFDGVSWKKVNPGSPFRAREGKWIGATVGFYSISKPVCIDRGWMDVDWFRVKRRP